MALFSFLRLPGRGTITATRQKPQPLQRRLLRFEPLEPRCMLTGDPDLVVYDEGWNVIDDDTGDFDYGSLAYNTTLEKTFHVHNISDETLNIEEIDVNALGSNFILTQSFSTTVLGPDDMVSFALMYDPMWTVGSHDGDVVFGTNAPGKDPYNFDITGTSVNSAPTSTGLTDVELDEDDPNYVVDLSIPFNDAEQDDATLAYSIVSNTNPGLFDSAYIDYAGRLTLDLAPEASGQAQLVIRATDELGLYVEDTLNVTVYEVNDAPVVTAMSYAIVENSLTIYGMVYDPDTPWNELDVYFNGLAAGRSEYVNPDFSFVHVMEKPSSSGTIGGKAREMGGGPEQEDWYVMTVIV